MAERTLLQRLDLAGPLTWVLAAGAGWSVLLWIAAMVGMGSSVAAVDAADAGALPQPRPAAPDRIGPLAQYAEAASRPLFTQDRRPRSFLATAPEADDGTGQSQSLDFILTGVLISPQVRLAILQPSGGGEAQRVRVGKSPEGAAGWRLLEVEPRRAIFEGNGGQTSLDLRTFGEAGTPTPQRVEAAESTQPGEPGPPPRPAVAPAPRNTADAAASENQPEATRIEEIRRRIEARRAQLRAAGQNGSPPPAPPGK